jgi:uncharacterized repeat protein (TIGR03806 family)
VTDDWPDALSDHPFFTGSPPEPSAALVPYAVNSPLWSDAADKERYLALPDGAAMQVQRDGSFELPPGGVLVKQFVIDDTRLETRFLARDQSGQWLAASYVWNDGQTDAIRTSDGATLDLEDQAWSVPTEAQCFDCHTDAAGISLGLEQAQMARDFSYPSTGRTADQIHTLSGLGFLEGDSDDEPLVDPLDGEAQLQARARSYLHANCSHCHRPGGLGEGEIDLRVSTPFRLTNTCDVVPLTADPVAGGGLIVAAGDPQGSSLYLRITETDDTWRMPPLGTVVVDQSGSDVVGEWIASLEGCP